MKHYRYLRYLIRHKWFVFIAGLKTGAPIWRLIIHDWSKFIPCEWIPYTEFFYNKASNITYLEWQKDRFDEAWLHHQHLNPHHWQHWILKNDDGSSRLLYIPQHFVKEMVADWMGAGRAITGKWEAVEWYNKNKDKIKLHTSSRQLVERLLEKSKKK